MWGPSAWIRVWKTDTTSAMLNFLVAYVTSAIPKPRPKDAHNTSSRRVVVSVNVPVSLEDIVKGATVVSGLVAGRVRALYVTPQEAVVFTLFSRRSSRSAARIFARAQSSLMESSFDPSLPTRIIIHGFTSHQAPGTGGHTLKDAILEAEPANVILVDWSALDTYVYQDVVERVVPQVGDEVAALMRLLVESGAAADSLHVMGHSLGAHIAGHAGSKVLGPVPAGRVTGLDAAGPMFQDAQASQRLDPSDAAFVDAIHTGADFLGISQPIGHVDFFPDGICRHCSAFELLAEAIRRPNSVVGTQCVSWDSFLRGECRAGNKAAIGINTDSTARGSFYLQTSKQPTGVQSAAIDVGMRFLQGRADPVALLNC